MYPQVSKYIRKSPKCIPKSPNVSISAQNQYNSKKLTKVNKNNLKNTIKSFLILTIIKKIKKAAVRVGTLVTASFTQVPPSHSTTASFAPVSLAHHATASLATKNQSNSTKTNQNQQINLHKINQN